MCYNKDRNTPAIMERLQGSCPVMSKERSGSQISVSPSKGVGSYEVYNQWKKY